MVFSYIKSKFINFSAYQSLCSKKFVSNGAILCLSMASSSLWRTSFRNYMVPAICIFGVKHIYSYNHLLHGARRFYHTNPYPLCKSLPRAIVRLVPIQRRTRTLQRWTKNKGDKWVIFLLGTCVVLTICFGRIERTACLRRFHVALSQKAERKLADFLWKMFEEKFQEKILPPSDLRSIRVQGIATNIIQALNNGLRLEHECKINGHAPKSVGSILKDEYHGASSASIFSTSTELEGKFGSEDGKGVQKSQKQARKLIWKPSTKHLNGKNWEIYVVDSYEVDTGCHLDGRIVVDTYMLRRLGSDAELAAIIGHEVGHAAARHSAEYLLKCFWFFIFLVILYKYKPGYISRLNPQLLDVVMKYLSRRREVETDYIGLILMASAGFDPRQAPKLYEKLGGTGGILSTHPSGSKRAMLLSKAKVMREAIAIYEEVRRGQGVRSFI